MSKRKLDAMSIGSGSGSGGGSGSGSCGGSGSGSGSGSWSAPLNLTPLTPRNGSPRLNGAS